MHQAKMIAGIDPSRLPKLLNGLSKSRVMNRDFVPSIRRRAYAAACASPTIRWRWVPLAFGSNYSIVADMGYSLGDHFQPHIDVIAGRIGVGTHSVCCLNQGFRFR